MLASRRLRLAPANQWGSILIPYLDILRSDRSSVIFGNTRKQEWTSLNDTKTINLPTKGESTFVMKTAKTDVPCADHVSFLLEAGKSPGLKSAGFDLSITKIYTPWVQPIPGMGFTPEY